jgi:hypothetical protein
VAEPPRLPGRPPDAARDHPGRDAHTEDAQMRANRTSITAWVLVALSILVLVGCAASGGAALSPVGRSVGDELTGGGPAPSGAPAPQAPDGEPTTPDQVGQLVDEAKIVRTGTIELEVADVATALTAARTGIRGMGGYIGASQTENVGDQPVATITYRVPVDRWEDALDLLRGLADSPRGVLNERTEAVEVTGAVVDLEARIRNLRASEAALQEISSRATRITDVLEVQAQLTSVRSQIEQLTAQLTQLNDRASYATLTATFTTPIVAVQVAADKWEPAKIVDEASASLVDIVQSLTTAGIWFVIVWVPVLLLMGGIALVVIFVLRRLGVRFERPGGAAVT